jgi:hypothetical protein
MKTLAAFSNPMGAHLLIARLEGSGIKAFTRDENIVQLEMGATNAFGGVKVDVADEDYKKAVEVRDAPPKNGETT